MSKELFRNFYTEFHQKRHKYGKCHDLDLRTKIIKETISKGKKVLDLGCRDGSFTENYIDGNEVIGVDVDDVALSLCRERLGIQTFSLDLNESMPFQNESFDVVVAGEIIEHLIFPELFIKEVNRVLRSSGIFCGSTPNILRMSNRVKFLLGKTPFFDDTAHLRFFSYKTLRTLLKQYFYEINIIPYGGHIVGNKKHGMFRFGIPVTEKTPLWLAKLFSSNLFWKAVKP